MVDTFHDYPDWQEPSNRLSAATTLTQSGTILAHDTALVAVDPELVGNVNGVTVGGTDQVAARIAWADVFGPDGLLHQEVIAATAGACQLWLPVQNYGAGFTVAVLNVTGAPVDYSVGVANFNGASLVDLLPPWSNYVAHDSAVVTATSFGPDPVPMAGIFDALAVTATVDQAATLKAHWITPYSAAGNQVADDTVTLGLVAAAGRIFADVVVRAPGLALEVTNDSGATMAVTVNARMYRYNK